MRVYKILFDGWMDAISRLYAMAKNFLLILKRMNRTKNAAIIGENPANIMAPRYLPPCARMIAVAIGAPKRLPVRIPQNEKEQK